MPASTPLDGSVAPTPPGGSAAATTTVRVYFFLGSFTGLGGLVPVERQVSTSSSNLPIERGAIEALLAGPNEDELGASPAMFTVMPEGTRLLGLRLDAGIATIDLSGEFASGGTASAKAGLAQVVYTLTQFPGIRGVLFELDGTALTTFTEAGLDLRSPVDRATYADQLPPIFIDQPAWGSTLTNPIHVTGLADVFEASFQVRLLDAAGGQIVDGTVMASCGTGCLGTFDETFRYTRPAGSTGTLQAYEPSAVDGSPTNVTEYPVTFAP